MAVPSATVPILDAAVVHEEKSTRAASIEAATPADSNIRVLSPSEYREAALTLAEAFCDDRIIRYPIDTPDRAHWTEQEKWELHLATLEYITYAHCLKGLVTTVGPGYDCVALWMPPGKNMDDIVTIIRSGLWRLMYKLSAQGKQRFFSEFLPLLHETKETVLGPRDKDSYYLVYLGTKEESRGRGYCRKLVEHITKRADEEGRACYLESSNDANPIIYGKLGFHVVKRISLVEGQGLVMDIMVREPAGNKHG